MSFILCEEIEGYHCSLTGAMISKTCPFPLQNKSFDHTETKQRFLCLVLEALSIKTLTLGDNLLKKLSLC